MVEQVLDQEIIVNKANLNHNRIWVTVTQWQPLCTVNMVDLMEDHMVEVTTVILVLQIGGETMINFAENIMNSYKAI
jgi:hypothetical protein